MNTVTLLSGETVEFPDPSPAVSAFLTRAQLAAADPNVSVLELTNLVYGVDNPLLDTTTVPGQAIVTRIAFANPIYHVLTDLIGRKQVQLGLLDMAKADARFTLSVPEVAERLGITPAAVRAAIDKKRFSAIFRNGQWWVTPESAEAYKVSNRGRKRAGASAPARVAPAAPPADSVVVRLGGQTGGSLSVRVANGDVVRTGTEAGCPVGHLPAGWSRAIVRTTSEAGSRAFEIEPAPGGQEEVEHAGLYVRGPFRVVKKYNSTKTAQAAWEAARDWVAHA